MGTIAGALTAAVILSVLCIGAFALAVWLYPTAYSSGALALISIAFVLVACGNSLFGLLTCPASRLLGDMAYGVYLLHGLMLFVVFGALAAVTRPATLSPTMHWLWILAMTPLLLIVCYAAFRWIERPAMRRASGATDWLRSHLGSGRGPAKPMPGEAGA